MNYDAVLVLIKERHEAIHEVTDFSWLAPNSNGLKTGEFQSKHKVDMI